MKDIYKRYARQTQKGGNLSGSSSIDNYIYHLIKTRDMRKYLLDSDKLNTFIDTVGKEIVETVESAFKK